jgi:hypothetical protein
MWLKALPAAAALAAWMVVPTPAANADGACTAQTNGQAHQACVNNLFGMMHSTCTYPDGSRDECDWHMTSLTTTAGQCTWFASAPAFPIGPPPPDSPPVVPPPVQ